MDNVTAISNLVISFATLVIAAILLFKSLHEWRSTVQQRERELRFQQANAGKEFLQDLFRDEYAKWALELVNFDEIHFPDRDTGESVEVKIQMIGQLGVRRRSKPKSAEEIITRCFDAVFYHLHLFQHFIDIGLTTEEDLHYPIDRFVKRLKSHKQKCVDYINKTTYPKAAKFLDNYREWQSENVETNQNVSSRPVGERQCQKNLRQP